MAGSHLTGTNRWLGALTALLLLLSSGCGVSWWESFRYNKKQPYDLYALYELLEARPAGLVFNQDSLGLLPLDSTTTANYVYVGGNIYFDEIDLTGLLQFVEQGNKAFVFTKRIPEDLSYHLFGPNCYFNTNFDYEDLDDYYEDTISLTLTNPELLPRDTVQLCWVYDYEANIHNWRHVSEEMLCDPGYGLEILGTLDSGRVNFARLRYGEGEILLHTNPELFTNYFLADSSRYDYARGVFSYLGEGPVIWDEYVRSYRPPPSARGGGYNPNGGRNLLTDNHALRYILEQPPLALAWYVLMLGGLLFVIFRGKRRQRIIPYRTRPENNSRQFVDTIARLTFQHGNHARLAKREVKMLRQYVQERYHLHWPEGEPPPPELALRSGLDPAVIERAAIQVAFVSRQTSLQEGDLIRFYRSVWGIYGAG